MLNRRTIIIGDVHGCLDELNRLIIKVNYRPEIDRLYFLGDIINRGPSSKAAFFRVMELGGVSVLGNHEWHLLQEVKKNNHVSERMIRLKAEFGDQFDRFISEIETWPAFIETDEWILVHAGVIPGRAPSREDADTLTTIRTWDGKGEDIRNPANPPWFELYKGEKLVVFGHWAALEGVRTYNAIGLDTGCVYGKRLSALILPEKRIVSVAASRVYRPVIS